VRCRAKWEWVSDEPAGGDGSYEWIGAQDATWDDGEEVVKTLSAVVLEAGMP